MNLPDDSPANSVATATPAPGAGPQVLVFTPDAPLAPDTTYTWRFITGEPAPNALNQIAFISHRSGVDNVWLMNPDGSNQRELTWELVPVSGYDISGDGTTIAYGAGGSVKTMSITGSGLNTLTPSGSFEYAPTITQDGTGVVVGRRDASGADEGYWRYPLVTGTDVRQIALNGAPGQGSAQLNPDGLTGAVGMTAWMPRAAYSSDGKKMLVVRGADDVVELVDIADPSKAIRLSIQGDSRPVWSQADSAFYLAASMDRAATWSCWRVALDGTLTSCGAARSDIAGSGTGLAVVVNGNDGAYHVSYEVLADLGSGLQRGVAFVLPGWRRGRLRQGRGAFAARIGRYLEDRRRRDRPDGARHRRVAPALGPLTTACISPADKRTGPKGPVRDARLHIHGTFRSLTRP